MRFIVLVAMAMLMPGCNQSQTPAFHFEPLVLTTGKGPASIEVADLNNDGLPDIVVANTDDSSICVFLNRGHRIFTQPPGSPFYAGYFPNDINIADFNQDGFLDIALANHERKSLTLLLGNGKGQFDQVPGGPVAAPVKPHTHGVVSADFNGDGNLDLATDSWAVDSIILAYGDGHGRFLHTARFETGKHPYQRLRTADFNKDKHPDIVTTNLDANTVTILLGDSKGNFSRSFFPAGNTPFGVAVGDINGDLKLDLAIINSPTICGKPGSDGLTVLEGDGKGHFSIIHGSPFPTGLGPTRLAIGDLNQDGVNDIVVTNYNSSNISVFYMGKLGLRSSFLISVGKHSDGIAIADMDLDGKKDILISSEDNQTVSILFNQ